MHSPKNQKMDGKKKKKKFEYTRIWLTNLKIKKERNRTFVLAVEVLIYSRAQRLLICFETLEATTLNLIGQTNQINKRKIL